MRIALLFSVLLAACATGPGRLEANRFQNSLYPYALFYTETGSAEYPLGPQYKVENLVARDPQHRDAKWGPEFTIERTYRDEQPAVAGRELFYDLLLARDQPAARLWLRSVPLAKADAEQPLATLAQRYLEAASKAVRAAAPFGVETELEATTPAEPRDVQVRACELSKREAVRLEFTLQNPAAVHTLSEPEWIRASVVVVRSGYLARGRYPVLIVAGKSSAVADASLDADFDRMLDQLVLGDKFKGLSMKGGHSCGKHPEGIPSSGAAPDGTSGDLRGPTLEVPIIQEDPPAPAP